MTDFNKGDFTQQGVDGHVNAKIRLNAKRYLDIDLTSNEEASGCTISGHVYDSLNDITYPIGSAPSGNIEITENTAEGEPLNIAQYATATVNVAGGGGDTYDIIAPEQTATGEYSEPYYVSTITESSTSLTTEYYPSVIVEYGGNTYTLAKDIQAGGYGDFVYDSEEDFYAPVFTNNPFALYVTPGIATFGEITLLSNTSFNGNIEIKAERVNPQMDLALRLGTTGTCYVNYIDGNGIARTETLHSNEADKVINVLNVENNVIMAFEVALGEDKECTLTGTDITLSHKAEANHVGACTFKNVGENALVQIAFTTIIN